MAKAATEVRRDLATKADAGDEIDSVEAEFGGELSEASLDYLRQFGRKDKTWGEVDRAEEQAAEPVSKDVCEEAVDSMKQYNQLLDVLKEHVPDDAERAWVDYKRALVQEANPQDVSWLKLKAYYHAIDALRAARGEDALGDPVQPEPSSSTAKHLPAAAAASDAATGIAAAADAVLRAARDMLPSSSSEVEDPFADAPSRASNLQATPTSTAPAPVRAFPPPGSQLGIPALTDDAAEDDYLDAFLDPSVTLYDPDYLEEQRLREQLDRQRLQRSRAFTFSLAAALGVSVVRWWLRRRRSGKRGGPQAGAAEAPKRAVSGISQ